MYSNNTLREVLSTKVSENENMEAKIKDYREKILRNSKDLMNLRPKLDSFLYKDWIQLLDEWESHGRTLTLTMKIKNKVNP